MPRFPTYERRVGLPASSTGSYASGDAFSAPGRALAGMGDALSGVGDQLRAAEAKIQSSQDDTWFSRARAETAMNISQFDTESRKAATGDAAGYQESVLGEYRRIRDATLANAPSPAARTMYEQWANGYEPTVFSETGKFRAASELGKRNDDFAAAMLAHTQTVFDNPDQYDAIRQRAMDDLEGAKQWMTPEQEIAARNKVEGELQLARAKSAIMRDPVAFQSSIGIQKPETVDAPSQIASLKFSSTVDGAIANAAAKYGVDADALRVIAQLESGGNPKAKNPSSSAGGLFQFIDSTARQYGLSNRYDAAQASDAAARLARGNASALRAVLGRDPNVGELYLAHQQGAGGATRLLSNPNELAVNIVGSKAVKLNGGNASMTAQEFANLWINKANKIAGGKITVGGSGVPSFSGNPMYSELSPDQMIGLWEESQSRIDAIERDQKAAYASELANIKGAFQLGIATGDASVTPQAIMSSQLADDDKAQLISSWNSANKDKITAADAAARLTDPNASFSVHDSDDRKAVGLAYDAAASGGSIFDDDAKARNLAEMIYSKSGIVPSAAMNEIRGGLVSGDPARVAAAASIANRMAASNPDALAANDGGSELVKAAKTYSHMTNRLGMSPDEAGKRMVDMADPEKARQREAILETKAVKDTLKEVDEADVRNIWDTFGPNALTGYKVGATDAASAIMVSDYRAMLEESIVEAAGDMDLAKEYAADRFKRNYGPSAVLLGGEDTISYLPPENFYPAGDDGTHGYIQAQLREALIGEGILADEVYLQATDATRSDVQAGQPPAYSVYYIRDGKLEAFPGSFRPDPAIQATTPDMQSSRDAFERNKVAETDRQAIIDSGGRGPSPLAEMQAIPGLVEKQTNEPELPPINDKGAGGGW